MIDHLRVLRERIDALPGFSAFIGQVPNGTPFPYVSLSAPGHDVPDEVPLCGPGDDLAADVRVMVTDDVESNVYVSLAQIRKELTPGQRPALLAMHGRRVELSWVRSEFVGTDRSVTYGATNRHPGYGVDTYRIVSQPEPDYVSEIEDSTVLTDRTVLTS